MRVETMRAVDRGVGRPLTALLTLVRRLLPTKRPPSPEEVRKVLFVKLSEMGALVLATPCFAEARRVFPNAEPWLLCFADSRPIAELTGGFPPERVIAVSASSLPGTISGLLGAIRRLRRERFDVVIDLEYFSRVSAILAHLSGAPIRVGFHRFHAEGLYCGDLFTHRLTFNPYLHIAQSMVMLARAAALEPGDVPMVKDEAPALETLELPRFEPTNADLSGIRDRLDEAGVPPGAGIVIVNPNSSDLLPLRRWPVDRFVTLCERLLDARTDIWIVLTGVADEREVGETIVRSLDRKGGGPVRIVSLIGKTTLRELFALFTLARVMVSADSGPPHFAAMTDVRGVTLFGPETPRLYGPVTPRNEAITANLACSPCINAWNRRESPCTDNQCMQRIDAESVADRVLRILADA